MNKSDVYQMVTDRIIESLKNGVAPWRKPWNADFVTNGPRNALTGRRYRGINVWLLANDLYKDNRWLTFNQAKANGGKVKKGEKGTLVVFWKWLEKEETKDGETVTKRVPFLRYYIVFNVEQCDGLKLPAVEEAKKLTKKERIAAAEAIVNGYNGPQVRYTESQAFYSPSLDYVGMPDIDTFETAEAFYATLFHELTHSTGHESRLNRLEPASFGSDKYAKEELVAEMGAAFICSTIGIDSRLDQSAAYISGWLSKLQSDNRFVVNAAAQAQKAADLILGDGEEDEAGEG